MYRSFSKSCLFCLILVFISTFFIACDNKEKTAASDKLVIYAALNEDEIGQLVNKFKADTGVQIDYILGGAGDMAARVQAERTSPNVDILVGGSIDIYGPLAQEGLFEVYDSPNNDRLDARFNDPAHFWQGWYMGVLGLAINRDRFNAELAVLGLAHPETWDDLLDPRYKDIFITSNPITAGGGYIFTACQIFRLGETGAWTYFNNLDKNVHHYTRGAGDVISPVATGEFIVGMSWAHDIYKQVKAGYPIDIVIPKQTAYEIGGVAIVKGGKNTDNAKKFVDWLLTEDVGRMNTINSNRYSVLPSVPSPQGLPLLDNVNLVNYDRTRAADMRPDVLNFS
jgi:iron(III) transport system substrate-binding protein